MSSKIINLKSILTLLAFLTLLITFDAAQQQFYVRSFGLNGSQWSFSSFLKLHFVRWLWWLLFTIPFAYWVWRKHRLEEKYSWVRVVNIIAVSLITICAVIMVISLVNLYEQQLTPTRDLLFEFYEFFVYQKGLIFFLAHVGVALWVMNLKQQQKIDAQWREIEILRKEHQNSAQTKVDKLIVKNGDLQEQLSVEDIVWVQADDYCVRVHTHDRSYYLRKSLKFLEDELEPFGFIRIHRGALLNINYLKTINYSTARVVLSNHQELPVSKTGQSILKKRIKETSL